MFVQAAREKLYGSDFLPLKPFDVLTMIIDTLEGTLRYVVNGVDAGIAFGPPGSGAACELPDGKAPFASGTDAVLFPSCSLTNDKQVCSDTQSGLRSPSSTSQDNRGFRRSTNQALMKQYPGSLMRK